MTKQIDYYASLQSPWTYLGHQVLVELARRHQASINVIPVNFGIIFPATGGLPLPKRAPERQAYRMTELKRWRDYRQLQLTLEPKHFPADERLAAGMVHALKEQDAAAATQLAGAILRAVWAEERDIGDRETLQTIAVSEGQDGATLLAQSEQERYGEVIAEASKAAIARGVFGAPSYYFGGELYWGQDRLDFLQRALS